MVIRILSLCFLVANVRGIDAAAKRVRLEIEIGDIDCDLSFFKTREDKICGGLTADRAYVINNGFCKIGGNDVTGTPGTLYTCQKGSWVESHRGDKLLRSKRWDWISTGSVGDLALALSCATGSTTSFEAPTFTSNCPPGDLSSEYFTADGQDTATVTWTTPTATDTDGNIQSVVQVLGEASGSSFGGSVGGKDHSIVYVATGNDGVNASCHFSFKVTVPTCSKLAWPDDGSYLCSNGNEIGSICTYTCDAGYQLSGSSSVTCQNSGSPTWTTQPSCERISCGSPPTLTNGAVSCADNSYTFGSTCTLECQAGYRLEGLVFMRCTEGGSWNTTAITSCKDDTAPDIFCQTPQVFYADRNATSTLVNPEMPSAVDNEDSSPTVTQSSGQDLTSKLETGTYSVGYKARDSEGNESPECTVTILVQKLSCGHPQDTMTDSNMEISCTGYSYGDHCSLGCYSNYPLLGTDLLTCESNNTGESPQGYWSWGSGSKPACNNISCPELDDPRNGFLDRDTVQGQPFYEQMCDSGYKVPDIGSGYTGIIICHDDGWSTDFQTVPGCIVAKENDGVRYSTEILYYNGDCSSESQLSAARTQITSAITQASTVVQGLCPSNTTCSAINPVVTCSSRKRRDVADGGNADGVGRRKRHSGKDNPENSHWLNKRQTGSQSLFVAFQLQANYNISGLSSAELYGYADSLQENVLNPAIQSMIDAGDFNVDSWDLQSDSLQSALGEVYCQDGYKGDGFTFICKPCPRGYYMTSGVCTECPIGQYTDVSGAESCTQCPSGYSTRFNASDSADNCTKMCGTGTYSPDTFEPCAECQVGYIQSGQGQTACTRCPSSQTTTSLGSTSVTDCQHYDVLLNGTSGDTVVGSVSSMDDLSLMFFVRKYSSVNPNVVISVNNILEVTITDSIRVHTPSSTFDETIGAPSSDAWSHVSVVWDTTNNRVSVYFQGELVISHTSITPSSDPLVQNGQLRVSAEGESGVYISGFSVQNAVIGLTEVQAAVTSCQVSNSVEIVSMDNFFFLNSAGVTVLSPSICDAIDECASSPCGSHDCRNEVGGYTCTCYNGWSGSNCTTPPDFCTGHECTNGATCVSGSINYTCICLPGYTGTLCEETPDDGGLSAWGTWAECSATCNTGTRSRERSCDSPQPDTHGNTCVGDLIETEDCNTQSCPACSAITGDSTTGVNCIPDVSTGTQNCSVQCQDGYVLPSGVGNQVLQCGLDTGYLWEPVDFVPSCVAPVVPSSVTLSTQVTYVTAVSSAHAAGVQTAVIDNMAATECHSYAQCQSSGTISNLGNRRRRSTGSTLQVVSTVSISDTSDADLQGYIAGGTASSSIQAVIDAVTVLESTAGYINSSASSLFDVMVAGVTYTSDQNTLTMCVTVDCEQGHAPSNGLCAPCPVGTYQSGDTCAFCDKGYYQTQTGQTACVACPTGFTTDTIGAQSASQCSVTTNTTSTMTSTVTTTTSTTTSPVTTTTSTTTSPVTTTTSTTTSPVTTTSSTTTLPVTTTTSTTTSPVTTTTSTTTSPITTTTPTTTSPVTTTTSTTTLPVTTTSSTTTSQGTTTTPTTTSPVTATTSTSTSPVTTTTSTTTSPVTTTTSTTTSSSTTLSSSTTSTDSLPLEEEVSKGEKNTLLFVAAGVGALALLAVILACFMLWWFKSRETKTMIKKARPGSGISNKTDGTTGFNKENHYNIPAVVSNGNWPLPRKPNPHSAFNIPAVESNANVRLPKQQIPLFSYNIPAVESKEKGRLSKQPNPALNQNIPDVKPNRSTSSVSLSGVNPVIEKNQFGLNTPTNKYPKVLGVTEVENVPYFRLGAVGHTMKKADDFFLDGATNKYPDVLDVKEGEHFTDHELGEIELPMEESDEEFEAFNIPRVSSVAPSDSFLYN